MIAEKGLSKFLVFCTLLVFCGTVIAQQSSVHQGTPIGIWRTYRYVDGLASNTVTAMLQAEDGALWFGTWEGVSRFDGSRWENYTKQDGFAGNGVHTLVRGRDGSIWAVGNSGVNRYQDGKWQGSAETREHEWRGVVALLQDNEGALWVGTWRGLRRYSREGEEPDVRTTKIRPPGGIPRGGVTALLEDRSGILWVGTMNGLLRFDGANWQSYTRREGFPGRHVLALLESQDGTLWIGTRGNGVVHFDGGEWTAFTKEDGLADDTVYSLLQDTTGALWFGTDNGGVSRFDGTHWRTYTMDDGLASNSVRTLLQDKEGTLWFGTLGGGVSCLDTTSWVVYTQNDGLPSNRVSAIMQDKEGSMWLGGFGGVVRFQEQTWQPFQLPRGPRGADVAAILQDASGALWFGKEWDGLAKFDGKQWSQYNRRNGFAGERVSAMLQDQQDSIWVATQSMRPEGVGVSHFDGIQWHNYGQKDGLASNAVSAIFEDREGVLWFGTGSPVHAGNGVSCFDGSTWRGYTQEDGLGGNTVLAVHQDMSGALWFGTYGDGVSRFDGEAWQVYTTEDGLGSDYVSAITHDDNGTLWFGTFDGGLSRFDGRFFQTLDSRDGLPNDTVTCLYTDQHSTVWAGTLGGGAIHFRRPSPSELPFRVAKLVADDNVYEEFGEPLQLPGGVKRVGFTCRAISFRTRPRRMLYAYQLVGEDSGWQRPTHDPQVEYFGLKPGAYTFQVQAIDRDLNYSLINEVEFQIPNLWHQTTLFLGLAVGGSASLLLLFAVQAAALVKRRRQVQAYQLAAVQEIQDAREMQLSLLPKQVPDVPGFDIAALCEPAAEVGGDYFTYLWLDDMQTLLGIVLIDVTGHGMKAAATTFLANGMLRLESQSGSSPDEIMAKMHRSLQELLPKRAFVVMSFTLIDLSHRTLTYFSAGQPDPILLHSGRPVQFPVQHSAPLGSSLHAGCVGTATQLEPGDVVLLFSDGLPEAINADEETYGSSHLVSLAESLAGKSESSQSWVDAIRSDVRSFTAPSEPDDDMTVVVLRLERESPPA